ncbi:MAG TPA: DUF4331 domain-containing protein [Caldilineaceae bacterium]|nr:DUF4331 domain-containing protein [Caldilineaceae bacterium]
MSSMTPARRWATRLAVAGCLVLTPLVLLAAVLVAYGYQASASSHREAPAISKDAYADTTDVYAFVSPQNQNNIVLIASWIPFEGPEGGPNYFEWDPTALYDIYVDNDGDAKPNFTYTVSSRVTDATPQTFLYNTGPIQALNSPNWNRRQYITVTETTANGAVTNLVDNKLTTPANIGSKSTPDYAALEQAAISTVNTPQGDIKIYAGQTDDAFWVDLQVFDLLTLRGQAAPIGYSQGNNLPVDSVSGFNVHSLVLEIPISHLKSGNEPVLGVWAGTRRDDLSGNFVQVSRLGMPLVNEVVIPLALKDAFNSLKPEQDAALYTSNTPAGNLLQKSVEDPEIGRLLCTLYSVPLPGDANDDCSTEVTLGTVRSGRGDIFDIFLTGMVLAKPFTIQTANGDMTLPANFNVNRPANVTPAEMIRINTDIKGSLCKPQPSRLGVLGGDACGFPNGRRLMDDIVEIELLAVAGAAYQALDGRDAGFSFNAGLQAVLDDGVDENDQGYRNTFPYIAMAQSGQSHLHENPVFGLYLPWMLKSSALAGLPGAQPLAGGSALLFIALIAPALVWLRRRR